MYKVSLTENFLEAYKKVVINNRQLALSVKKTLKLLEENPQYPSLKSHKVNTRNFGVAWSSRVTGDIRLIWKYDTNQVFVIRAITIGGHTGKYKVYN
jgi:mRNA-degrading endonuclease YafQ of YafQ-DinJ toxin-antitoxin module